MKFTTGFEPYACDFDEIICRKGSIIAVAKLYRDDCRDRPDERDCGFWPSQNPNDAGYVGEVSDDEFKSQCSRAEETMKAWHNGEWWYVGVAVRIWVDEMPITEEFTHAVWGIECNYPGGDNSYLLETANELLPEALEEFEAKLEALKGISL
jgi:hypothetical protein